MNVKIRKKNSEVKKRKWNSLQNGLTDYKNHKVIQSKEVVEVFLRQ